MPDKFAITKKKFFSIFLIERLHCILKRGIFVKKIANDKHDVFKSYVWVAFRWH